MNQKLLERIKRARSSKDIQRLLTQGEAFQDADAKTRRKWKRAAQARLLEVAQ